ncbi:hypothetical protein [Maritimibacter sp. DP1N21-5]|uniref:hypothetical protein n=1 Tax=Maritimibacter sp. DP1N21-5 TaxID=2836867 RepID=UPI001C4888F3|nr:hypothetical protein [Maritimibacter sp. DP1N21-5]MBV7410312.1 hypothetical protein [Maritimibacter sp. DP1N21-5]
MFEPVNIGTAEDDGSGDSLRDAFEKLNRNFTLLSELMADVTAQLADARAAQAPEWPGSFVARHVTDVAPDTAPPMLGALWVDTVERVVYVSTGTGSVSDWMRLNTDKS